MPASLSPGAIKIDTPVGAVAANLQRRWPHQRGQRGELPLRRAQLAVEVPGIGRVVGDVAWGGNWFFLISEHGQIIDLEHVEALTDFSWRVRAALNAQGHPLVDHVELFSAARSCPGAHSRNFVLCPGQGL